MKKILSITLAALMLLALALSFVGCSDTKSVVIGYTVYAPMNYPDDSGKLIGFDTELAENVFAKLGYNVVFKEIDWNNKYIELNAGTVDCLWNGFTANTADDDGDDDLHAGIDVAVTVEVEIGEHIGGVIQQIFEFFHGGRLGERRSDSLEVQIQGDILIHSDDTGAGRYGTRPGSPDGRVVTSAVA